MRKPAAVLLAVLLLCIPFSAGAAEDSGEAQGTEYRLRVAYLWEDGLGTGLVYDGLEWYQPEGEDDSIGYRVLDDGTAEVLYYRGSWLEIPDEIDGRPVTSLGLLVSSQMLPVSDLVIPDSLTHIDPDAFSCLFYGINTIGISDDHPAFVLRGGALYTRDGTRLIVTVNDREQSSGAILRVEPGTREIGNCAMYNSPKQQVVLPEGLERIGDSAFFGMNELKEIAIPDSVTEIGRYAFEGAGITELALPDGTVSIGSGALAYTAVKSFRLPAGLEEVTGNPFTGCEELEEVTVPEGTGRWRAEGGILYDDAEHTLIAVWDDRGQDTFAVPEGVIRIAECAFAYSGFRRIELPDSVTEIGQGAFQGCEQLEEIRLPSGISTVPGHAFMYCFRLRSVMLPEGLERIGNQAFCECTSLEQLAIPDSVTEIGIGAFERSGLREIGLPASLRAIPDGCLMRTKLEFVRIPESVGTIGEYAFFDCGELTEMTIPDSVTAIGEEAFEDCGLLTLTVGKDSEAQRYCERNRIPFVNPE